MIKINIEKINNKQKKTKKKEREKGSRKERKRIKKRDSNLFFIIYPTIILFTPYLHIGLNTSNSFCYPHLLFF